MSFRFNTTVRLIVVGLLMCCVIGCGRRTYPVRGKVTFKDGTPLTQGTIAFMPLDEENKKVSCRAFIREDGTYEAGTYQDTDGAYEGRYELAVSPGFPPNPDRPPKGWPPINRRFGRFEESGLKLTVKPETNVFDIIVEK